MDQPTCAECRELLQRVAELEAKLRELQSRLGQNATNSSIPPSANPFQAPPPVVNKPTGHKPGGQPGHSTHWPFAQTCWLCEASCAKQV
jgi:transposase